MVLRTDASDARVRKKGCRLSWGSPGIGNIILSIRGLAANFDTLHPLATWLRWCPVVFPCSSSGIHCFPMVLEPLSLAVLLASWAIHPCTAIRDYQSLESVFFLFIVSSSGQRQTPQEDKVNPSGMCFKHEWHWTVLDICPNSYDSMLPSSRMMRLDSSLNFKKSFLVFPDLMDRFRVWTNTSFSTTSVLFFNIRSTSFKITLWATLSILRST